MYIYIYNSEDVVNYWVDKKQGLYIYIYICIHIWYMYTYMVYIYICVCIYACMYVSMHVIHTIQL